MYNLTKTDVSNHFENLFKMKVEVDFSMFEEALCEAIQKAVFIGETAHPRYPDERVVCVVFDSTQPWDSCDVTYELGRLNQICEFLGDESIVLREGKDGLDYLYVSRGLISDIVDDGTGGKREMPLVTWCQCCFDPTK